MIINSVNSDHIRMIKAIKDVDEWNRPFFKVQAYVLQKIDLKSFRDKQSAQDYLDTLAEEISNEGADHIVIASELQ